jgi:hypothetical protein
MADCKTEARRGEHRCAGAGEQPQCAHHESPMTCPGGEGHAWKRRGRAKVAVTNIVQMNFLRLLRDCPDIALPPPPEIRICGRVDRRL